MSQYDETNSGVLFQPYPDQSLRGQGKLNIEGKEVRIIMVKEKMSRDGKPQNVVYQRLGVLFDNSEGVKKNEKAPNMNGPIDDYPHLRMAGWIGQKDGRHYVSLKVSEKDRDGGAQQPAPPAAMPDDEIPF